MARLRPPANTLMAIGKDTAMDGMIAQLPRLNASRRILHFCDRVMALLQPLQWVDGGYFAKNPRSTALILFQWSRPPKDFWIEKKPMSVFSELATFLPSAYICLCIIPNFTSILFTTPEIDETYVEKKGYPIEKHEIETEDGFKLTYHRVPHGRQGEGQGHGHPVLLAHGILQSSAAYLAMDDGLAYLLADAGFDVWLMNARGNMYSRAHKQYTPGNKEFWDFSFHEMGRNDLPAVIEYILLVTKRSSLSYVGFSMATTMFWVLADSWGPKYMDRVDTMVAIAPVARPSGMSILQNRKTYKALSTVLVNGLNVWGSYLNISATASPPKVQFSSVETNNSIYYQTLYNVFHSYEVRPFNPTEALLFRTLCSNGQNNFFCSKMLSGLVGLFPDSIHYEDTYVSTQYMPAGTSIKNVQHFLQIGEKASFQQFDYGQNENQKRYDSSSPPVYDLRKVTCPVFFITSDKDSFSVKEDVDFLANQLPSKPQILFYDAVKDFNHLDYFYFKTVKSTLYEPLVKFMSERRNQLKN